jgi:transcriptional regulator with XRE-family HTH domain
MGVRKPPEEKLKAQGARIRQAIDKSGKQYVDVARELGVAAHTVDRWMRGDVSAAGRFADLSIATGARVEWLRDGEGDDTSDRASVIETFIIDQGPSLRPPLTNAEAAYLRQWPHHRVKPGALMDAVMDARHGLRKEDLERSVIETAKARARGEALGVPRRSKR